MGLVQDFADAFNRRDVDALLACFTAEASYVDGFYGRHAGAAALRAMFERMFREGRDYRGAMDAGGGAPGRAGAGGAVMWEGVLGGGGEWGWGRDAVGEAPDRAMAEWTFSYVVSDAIPRSAGRPIRFRGTSVFEVARGRVAAYREYFDTGQALLQLGFAPDALARVLARKLEGR